MGEIIMKCPVKCGKMYIKFDDDNQPEYGFEVGRFVINKFFPLCDKSISKIILPQISNSTIYAGIRKNEIKELEEEYNNIMKAEYAAGELRIAKGCFSGIKNAKIIIPFENSIMLDWGAFDKDAQIELVLPKAMSIKQVFRRFDNGFDYENECWLVVANKKFNESFGNLNDNFLVEEFEQDKLKQNFNLNFATLKIEHLNFENLKQNKTIEQ